MTKSMGMAEILKRRGTTVSNSRCIPHIHPPVRRSFSFPIIPLPFDFPLFSSVWFPLFYLGNIINNGAHTSSNYN